MKFFDWMVGASFVTIAACASPSPGIDTSASALESTTGDDDDTTTADDTDPAATTDGGCDKGAGGGKGKKGGAPGAASSGPVSATDAVDVN